MLALLSQTGQSLPIIDDRSRDGSNDVDHDSCTHVVKSNARTVIISRLDGQTRARSAQDK